MSETADRLRGATRWSMASRCARQASYGLLGVDPVPPTQRESGRMARGRDAGRHFARQMEAKHGAENVVFEMGVPWPAPPALPVGELHIDVGLLSDRIAIEAKNSIYVDSMYDAAVIQVAGAVHFGAEHFDSGLVVFMDRDYQITHEFPVFLNDELVEKVEAIAAAVIAVGKEGTKALPERVCGKPADGRGRFCPFIEHCFTGWAAPPAQDRADLSQFASEGWLIQRDLKAAKGNVGELQERWDEWKEKMSEVEIPPGVEIFAGPIKIKRIDVKARETFSKAKATTAGVWTALDDERFGAFVKIGEPSVRFELYRTEAGDLDIDYGEEAPF
jgi:hypothetical protein